MIEVVAMVCCDSCDQAVGSVAGAGAARAMAHREGWVYVDGKDYCPECAKKVEDAIEGSDKVKWAKDLLDRIRAVCWCLTACRSLRSRNPFLRSGCWRRRRAVR